MTLTTRLCTATTLATITRLPRAQVGPCTHTPDGAVVKVKVETADVHHVESRSASVDGRNGSFCSFSLSVKFV